MKTRNLGATGEKVSALGLGCMGMTGRYGPADTQENLAVLHKALDIGINFLDTADMYGSGENEKLLSEILATRRDEVFLATKFGFRPDASGKMGVDVTPEYARQAIDASLRRLKTDHVDLYYAHRVDPKVPVEETVGALGELVKAGKVRYIGICEASEASVRRAHKEYPLAAVQSEYSLLTREPEEAIIPACAELGISFVPYSPLSRGLVTAVMPEPDTMVSDDFRRSLPRFTGENLRANKELAREFASLAQSLGCSAAQLALAWILHKGDTIIPIPGTKRLKYLEENAGATEINLDKKDMERIEALLEAHPAAGQRYDAGNMGLVDR
ncbi:MAG: aldo/keto reductase [Spirochaetia bacterium]|jgi:aryl-alcohol dehydrogenase-like predicted oxidoreductase|nr:aldo/keto reductase [Spirochaetia bacterium]